MTSPLIEVEELEAALRGDDVPLLADVRWNLAGPPGRPEYEAGHLPGAQWVDLEHELAAEPGAGGRHPLPDPERFDAAMRSIGLTADRPVVVYDGASSLAASRLWWLLTDAGHERVRVLNGGFAAWRAAGRPVQTGAPEPVPPGTFRGRPGRRARVDAAAVAARLGDPVAAPLVDVRAVERYAGEVEPIDPVAGHIPGAVSRPSTENLRADGRFLDATAVAERFAGLDQPVLYCGSGITAAHTLLALESAGIGGSIYPGSWSDWITDPSRPVATGRD